eukprot:364455-Chlamydomonas_euryale.AAC.9
MAEWRHDGTAAWQHGSIAARRHGGMTKWRHGGRADGGTAARRLDSVAGRTCGRQGSAPPPRRCRRHMVVREIHTATPGAPAAPQPPQTLQR